MFDLRRHLEPKLSSFDWKLWHPTLLLSDNVFVLRAFGEEKDPQTLLTNDVSVLRTFSGEEDPNTLLYFFVKSRLILL
jgi:hypothetical protein